VGAGSLCLRQGAGIGGGTGEGEVKGGGSTGAESIAVYQQLADSIGGKDRGGGKRKGVIVCWLSGGCCVGGW